MLATFRPVLSTALWLVGLLGASATSTAEPAWGTLSVPAIGSRAQFFGSTVAAPGQALAVGAYNPGETPSQVLTRPHAQHWNGLMWQATAIPLGQVYPNQSARLAGASSDGDGQAWAVGYVEDVGSLSSRTLAYRWDGGQWLAVPTPNPGPAGTANRLHAVLGGPSDTAWAVGEAGYPARSLLLRWNGNAWRELPVPDLGPLRALTGDDSALWAAGERQVMRSIAGRRWTPLPAPPVPASATQIQIAGIAAQGTRLWIVGAAWRQQGEGLVAGPYAAHWTGGGWTLLSSLPTAGPLQAVVAASGQVRATSTSGNILRLEPAGAQAEVTPAIGALRLETIAADTDGRTWAAGTLYDEQGTPRAATLTAPAIGQGGLRLQTRFAQAQVTWLGPVAGSGEADAFGAFAVGGLAVGRYQLVVAGAGCAPVVGEIDITEGLVSEAELALNC
jgi:hypothetical protein